MIYNDLNESNYIFNYNNYKLYFSSKFYLEKFTREYSDFIKNESIKLRIKFKCNLLCDEMIILLLYKKIEKRGFKVKIDDKDINENYTFNYFLESR